MRTARSPNHGRRPTAQKTLLAPGVLAPAVLAAALLATAAVGVIAGRPVAALSTANSQAAIEARAVTAGKASAAKTAKTPGWRVVATIGPFNKGVSGALTADSAKDAWSVWTGTGFTQVQRLVGTKWTRVPLPAKLTDYVRSAVAFDGDSAADFWLLDSYRTNRVLRFTGGKWTLQPIPSWVLPLTGGGGELSDVTATAFGPGNVWVFNYAYAYAAHYNGHAWAKVKLPLVPGQVSAVSPDDIWAIAGTGANVAWRWNGKAWTAIKIPKAGGNQPEDFGNLTATGPRSAWVWRTLVAPSPGGLQTDVDVLRWNGTSWRRVAGTPADIIDSVASDGSGGLWATGVDINPGGFNLFYHLTGGRWKEVSPPAGIWDQQPEYLTAIPGTRSVWGTATGLTNKGDHSVVIKYGP
jgi:hypothetical protein